MSAADDAKVLDHYLRYILRGETGPLRDRLQRGLVERGLKTGRQDHVMTSAGISANICRACDIRDYPEELVLQGLSGCLERGDVESAGVSERGDSLFRLSETRFNSLASAFAEADETRSRFHISLLDSIRKRVGVLDETDADRIIEAFDVFLGTVLGNAGDRCARNLVHEQSVSPLEYQSARTELEAALSMLPESLHQPVSEVFSETLHRPTPDQEAYLYTGGQVYYMTAILNFDPELQALERIRFEDTTVVLDTNVLVAAVLEGLEEHAAMDRMLGFSKQLGLKLRYTPRTESEFIGLLDAADAEYRAAPPIVLRQQPASRRTSTTRSSSPGSPRSSLTGSRGDSSA